MANLPSQNPLQITFLFFESGITGEQPWPWGIHEVPGDQTSGPHPYIRSALTTEPFFQILKLIYIFIIYKCI